MSITRREFGKIFSIASAGAPLFALSSSTTPWYLQAATQTNINSELQDILPKAEIRSKQEVLSFIENIDIHQLVRSIFSLLPEGYPEYTEAYKYLNTLGSGYKLGTLDMPVANLNSPIANLLINEIIEKNNGAPPLLRFLTDSTALFYRPITPFFPTVNNIRGMTAQREYIYSGFENFHPKTFELQFDNSIKYSFVGSSFPSIVYPFPAYEKVSILRQVLTDKPSILITGIGSGNYLSEEFLEEPYLNEKFASRNIKALITYITETVKGNALPVFITPSPSFITKENEPRFFFDGEDQRWHYLGYNYERYRGVMASTLSIALIANAIGLPIINMCSQMQKLESEYLFYNDPFHIQDFDNLEDREYYNNSVRNLRDYKKNPVIAYGLMVASTIAEIGHKFNRQLK